MKLLDYLKMNGVPTTTNGILFKSKESDALGLRFGEGELVKDGGTAQVIWLTKNSCETNGWSKGSDVFNKIPELQMLEVTLTSGGTAWKLGMVGELVAQRSILDLFSAEDQAAFAELEAAAETKIN